MSLGKLATETLNSHYTLLFCKLAPVYMVLLTRLSCNLTYYRHKPFLAAGKMEALTVQGPAVVFVCNVSTVHFSCGVDRYKCSKNQDKTIKRRFFSLEELTGVVVTLLIQRHQPPSSHSSCCQLGEGCIGSESSQELHLTTTEREEAAPVF